MAGRVRQRARKRAIKMARQVSACGAGTGRGRLEARGMIFSGAICFRVLAAISITISITRLFISLPFTPLCQAAPAQTAAWRRLDELCPSRSLQDEVGESDDDYKPFPHVGRLKRLRAAKCSRFGTCFKEKGGPIASAVIQ